MLKWCYSARSTIKTLTDEVYSARSTKRSKIKCYSTRRMINY